MNINNLSTEKPPPNSTVYRYTWANNPKRAQMKGRLCLILCRGKMNSVGIEFKNGQRECVSRYAIMREGDRVEIKA